MKNEDNSTLDRALKDIELDEILNSMKNNGDKLNALLNDEPFEIPVVEPIKEKPTEENDIKPPKVIKKQPKPKKEKKPREKKEKPKKFSPSPTNKVKGLSKKAKLILVAIAVVIVTILGIIAGINYSKTAYLKPYESKYGIEYPKGIKEEFCDVYAMDQNLEGKINFADLDKNVYIYSYGSVNKPYFEKGSSAGKDQQFKAVAMDKLNADLESVYSTLESYVQSSQQVVFEDIYGEEKTYQVVASYYVTTNAADDNGYLFPYNLYGDLTEDSFDQFEDRIHSRSLFHTDYDMSYNDKYLTISVNSDFMSDFRFVILCVEVNSGVTPYTTGTNNDKIHYPQIWYDKNNAHNSYWLSSKWQPTIYTDKEHTVTKQIN